jgi:ElaB/YqjD/DUF883 family membrane-anchored ribosome-binding protein
MTTKTQSNADEAIETARQTSDDLAQRARGAASSVSSAAESVTNRIPEAASEVDRVVRASSDDTLRLATVAAVGVSAGLLLGGANRLLVLAALAPAAFMGLVLSGRRSV